jgi:hypothetical protein
MNTAGRRTLTMVAILVIICGAAATAQSTIDISGTWVFTMQNAAGSVPAQVTLKVDRTRLTGTIVSTISGDQSFVGVVDNGGFQFAFDGDACSVTVVGKAESRTTLKGTFDNPGGGGTGTFTATRKE